MTDSDQQLRDPVCKMQVAYEENALEHMGIYYAFCSLQCRERFLANPHLYIGQPGEAAPVQRGEVSIKRRRLRLAAPLNARIAATVTLHLMEMMGVEQVQINGRIIHIRYDLLEATAEQLEAVIATSGGVFSQNWLDRLRRRFVHAVEANEMDAREVTTKPTGGDHRH